MSANTIVLKGCHGSHEEAPASAALYPGHLVELLSNGKVRKQSLAGARCEMAFAKEDALQGNVITDAYAADDVVPYYIAGRGDRVQCRLPANALAVVIGDFLAPDGAGCFVKAGKGNTLLYSNVAESAEHENTTDAANFDKSFSIPANFLQAGDVLRIRGHVTVNDNNSTDTLTLLVTIGGTTIIASAALDVADGDVFYFDIEVIIRTIGASGTMVANGITAYDAAGTDTEPNNFVLASTAIDTTVVNVVAVNADWSVAHADNEASLTMLTVELARKTGTPALVAIEAVDNSAVAAEALIAARVL